MSTYSIKLLLLFFLAGSIFTSCDISQKETKEADLFFKVYNSENVNLHFYPVDVIQTADNGYLILSSIKNDTLYDGNDYPYTNLIKTDELGAFEWTLDIPGALSPVHSMFAINNNVGFVAMNAAFEARVYQLDPTNSASISSQSFDNIRFPVSSYQDSNGDLIVVSEFNGNTNVYKLDNAASSVVASSSTMQIGSASKRNTILNHSNKTGREIPFFISEFSTTDINRGYAISLYENETLRTMFFGQDLGTLGNKYVFQDFEFISTFTQKNDSSFAFVITQEGRSMLHGHESVDLSSIESYQDLNGGEVLREVADYYPNFKYLNYILGNTERNFIASNTNGNDLILFQLSDTSATIAKKQLISFDDEIELRSIIQTKDGGIMVLAKYFLNGKYARPAIRKIAKADL
jgi:hypothetical protein